MNNNYKKTILIAGVGGQGTLLASNIIGNTAVKKGYKIRVSETFGMSQRGGSVVTHIRLGDKIFSPITPLHTADIIIGFEPLEAYRNALKYLRPGGKVIINTKAVQLNDESNELYPSIDKMIKILSKLSSEILTINATELAEKIGSSIMMNMVMLGACAEKLPFNHNDLQVTMKEILKKDTEQNFAAFEAGMQAKIQANY